MRTIVDKQPGMGKVFEKIDKLSMNKTLLSEYDIRKRAAMDEKARLDYSFEKGIQKGIEKNSFEIAKKMLRKGLPVSDIIEFTGLSKDEILKLQ